MSDKKAAKTLAKIKEQVRRTREYWLDNVDIYRKYRMILFKTSLSDDAKAALDAVNKPALEFNILEAMYSKMCADYAKQEPSIEVRAADGIPQDMMGDNFEKQLEVVGGYIREILLSSENDNLQLSLFGQATSGGFSIAKVEVDYIDSLSFDHQIKVVRVFDPTLCGFDPMARLSSKADGEFCFEVFPMRKDEFDKKFGKEYSAGMQYARSFEGFSWSYKNIQEEKVIIVVEFFQKRRKKMQIAKLTNGHVINNKHYPDLVREWDRKGYIQQVPGVVSVRMTEVEVIDRYMLCENKILEYGETDFAHLPLVFFDGNSELLQDSDNDPTYQMVRPFHYHAKDTQLLKNFAGQTIASDMQNQVQHKFMIPVEGIPTNPQHQNAYRNVQVADVLPYNAFDDKDPTKAIPPPREIQRTALPPIVQETFMGTDNTMQMVVGSYDTVLGTNANQLSGKAIQAGGMQSAGSAMPYYLNQVRGLNQLAIILLDLIPKYLVTPRTIPVRKSDGKRYYQKINDKNDQNSISMGYSPSAMNITVSAGVSCAMAKEAALDSLTKLMAQSPGFANFIDSKGLEILVDNLDIRGADHLKKLAAQYIEEMSQQPPKPSEAEILAEAEKEIEGQKTQAMMQKNQADNAVATAKVAVDKQNADTKFLELMMEVEYDKKHQEIERMRADAENAKDAVETALKITESMMGGA